MRMVFLAGVAACFLVAGSASAASFTNGGFEAPGGSVREGLSLNLVPGWTYSDNGTGFDIYESDDQSDGLAAADGTHYVSFGHNGTYGGSISQTFDTTPGQHYTITYSVAEQQGDDPSQDMMLTLSNGTATLYQHTQSLGSVFADVTTGFVANGTTATLTFTDDSGPGVGGGSNLALDYVRVNGSTGAIAGVPEPATWAMMLAGFGGLGAVARKARRDKALASA